MKFSRLEPYITKKILPYNILFLFKYKCIFEKYESNIIQYINLYIPIFGCVYKVMLLRSQ